MNVFSETAGRPEFAGTFATDEIIGNPLQAFQLVKRLTIDWRKIEELMEKENYWKGMSCAFIYYNLGLYKSKSYANS